jgi:hypothetical protein
MYVDGVEMPMEGGEGEPVVLPNAPLDQPPTGLFVGTLPWVTGLDNVDFPCCGTIQFSIPGKGLTNVYEFNVRDFGCATPSIKECPSEWTVHEDDLVIAGTQTYLIENEKFFQKGNIYVRDTATLIIRNSELMMARGNVPTVHVYIFVDPMATLIMENSLVYPQPEGGLVCVMNRGEVRMTDSPTSIHYFDMSAGAQLTMVNSEMVFTLGGLLQVTGGNTTVTDSTLGALALSVPAGAHLNVTGLHSGIYYDYWDVHNMIPDADYNLVLERTTILKDDFTGFLEHGPYERGWIFFLDPDAHVRISDSELRKVFLDSRNETAAFQDLRVGVPASLTYRDIVLTNVIVKGQWPFTITDADVTITNSDYLFLQPSGSSTIRLINSHMVEFIPRNFFGTMIFENGLWTTAGEIIGGVPYHSMANDFVIKGSLRMEGLRENLRWNNARVTREFDVIVTDIYGYPLSGVVIKVGGKTYVTDDTGKTKFNMIFNETNYNQPTTLEAWQSGQLIASQGIDFFTETPIRLSKLPIFADVPFSYWANSWIERLYNAGITTGCSTNPLMYCPENSVTRAQMAIFLERGMNGPTYTPPPGTGTVFTDVPLSYWAVNWIEKLFADGITTGCGTSPLVYCPEQSVTRAQMAVFLLRAKHDAAYNPPAAAGLFADVPTFHWAAAWIEQLYTEGITTGCGTSPLTYCPDDSVTRAEMAVFLVRTFNLP